MTASLAQVNIDDFEIDQILLGDIVDDQEKVLFRQGLKLTNDILAAWQRRGDGPFFLRSTPDAGLATQSSATHEITSGGHDPELVKQVFDWFDITVEELDALVGRVLADQLPTLNGIEASVERFQKLLEDDAAAVAYCVIERGDQANSSPSLRCAFMAALVGVVGQGYGLSHDDCYRTCLAALLHDLALFPGILEKIQDAFESEEERQTVVVRHGFFSSDLLSARTGLPEHVRIIMQQVHEQMDGTGYPRGIPGHVINVMSRLINVVDAFLTLVVAGNCGAGFIPADAIAYLVHHTSRGAFDREAMLAFIKVQTMYGIGSRVELDDGRQATVLRSAESNPLRPIVCVHDDSDTIVDLTQTELNIVKPVEDQRFAQRSRLAKPQMQAILWQQYNSLSPTAVSLF